MTMTAWLAGGLASPLEVVCWFAYSLATFLLLLLQFSSVVKSIFSKPSTAYKISRQTILTCFNFSSFHSLIRFFDINFPLWKCIPANRSIMKYTTQTLFVLFWSFHFYIKLCIIRIGFADVTTIEMESQAFYSKHSSCWHCKHFIMAKNCAADWIVTLV